MSKTTKKPLIALMTNDADDIYCFRKELIEALIENGYQVLISCPYGDKFELMKDIPYLYDDPFIDRRGTSIVNDGKLYLHYRKLLKKYRPAVVLAYTAKPNVYGSIAAHQLKIPVINNVTGVGSVLNKSGIMQKFIMGLFRMAYRKSDCIMFQNSTNMELAKKLGMIHGDYKLIPGSGVDTDRYPLQNYPEGGNGIEGDKVVFNYIGRILHDKGVDDYMAVAKNIKKNYHGSQKDVKPYIQRAHAIIHPSTYGEGMSNVLLENASSGRPLITTDNPGCQETVQHEKTGFIYHGGNVDELYATIERFLQMSNEERKSMGEKGRAYIKENFSRKIVIDAYLSKISELIQK